jgi:plastocyanin
MDLAVGGTVLFVNATNVNHNVTFPQLRPIGGDVATARQFGAIRFFSQPGRYPFQCTIHPGMAGVVVVH